MTYWKTEHFRALQKAWYKRLEESGFQDHEQIGEEDFELKSLTHQSAHAYNWPRTPVQREAKEAYFRLLSRLVDTEKFRNDIDQLILTRYAAGAKIQSICLELKEIGRYRCRRTIRVTVRRYEMAWGLRTYSPQQMNEYHKVGKAS